MQTGGLATISRRGIIRSTVMSDRKEEPYRYDLFITPDWRDRFDALINENVKLPLDGRILDVNTGTGAHAIELAEGMRSKGEVVGLDPSAERIAIARAKAQVRKVDNITFDQGIGSALPFDSHEFDAVIGDASMTRAEEIEEVLAELVRVAKPGARIVLKITSRGSFDDFFSIYWEALHDVGLDDDVWNALEDLINERLTLSDSEALGESAGLRKVESIVSKEEFQFEDAQEFLESPLINDFLLSDWLDILPEASREDVRARLAAIIERERHETQFEVSIKATIISGIK